MDEAMRMKMADALRVGSSIAQGQMPSFDVLNSIAKNGNNPLMQKPPVAPQISPQMMQPGLPQMQSPNQLPLTPEQQRAMMLPR